MCGIFRKIKDTNEPAEKLEINVPADSRFGPFDKRYLNHIVRFSVMPGKP